MSPGHWLTQSHTSLPTCGHISVSLTLSRVTADHHQSLSLAFLTLCCETLLMPDRAALHVSLPSNPYWRVSFRAVVNDESLSLPLPPLTDSFPSGAYEKHQRCLSKLPSANVNGNRVSPKMRWRSAGWEMIPAVWSTSRKSIWIETNVDFHTL